MCKFIQIDQFFNHFIATEIEMWNCCEKNAKFSRKLIMKETVQTWIMSETFLQCQYWSQIPIRCANYNGIWSSIILILIRFHLLLLVYLKAVCISFSTSSLIKGFVIPNWKASSRFLWPFIIIKIPALLLNVRWIQKSKIKSNEY